MTDITTPLKPLLENTHTPNSSRSATQSKILSSPDFPKKTQTPSSPSRPPFSASMSKLSHSSAASSSFFSSPPGKGDRGESPSKMSDFEFIDDDDLYAGEAGDDTVCSTFSDVNIGQYGQDATARGNSVKRSAAKPRPQTPPKKRHQTTSVAATPTPRTGSRGSLPFSELTEEVTPRAHPTQAPDSHSQSSGFLLDFTTQFNAASHPQNQDPTTPSHRRTRSASPNKQASPAKFPLPPSTPAESRFFNLLDFSPGPLATPRSIPSITPREVESLKASYQSQISQLKAELSGREVEITGLRDAVRESEDRSAAMAHTMKQQEVRLEEERDNWRNVRNELGELFEAEKAEKATLRAEFEKRESELTEQTEDAVRELEEARQRANVAEEEAARAQKEAEKAKETAASRPSTPSSATAPTSPGSSANVQAEVEKVARELHSLYKAKHESKVAALKKSYESRWEKKIGQLQAELEAEKRRNEELQSQIVEKGAEDLTGDIGFSPARPASSSSPASEELKEELTRLKQELSIVQSELETERREKGELVGAVEELLAIQAGPGGGQAQVETEKVKKRVARVSGVGLPSGMTGGGFQGGLKSGIARMGGGVRDKN